MSIGTRLFTWLNGEQVGSDEFGNRYYVHRRTKGQKREKRWVRELEIQNYLTELL